MTNHILLYRFTANRSLLIPIGSGPGCIAVTLAFTWPSTD